MIAYTIIEHGTLNSHREDEEYDMCEPRTEVYMIETEDQQHLDDETRNGIHDRFRRWCSCAHDCCGHRNGGVTAVATMWPGRYLITVSTSLNY
jgi:hypothetical protein